MSQFSPAEKKAFIVATALFVAAFAVQWLGPHSVEADLYDYSVPDSVFNVLVSDTLLPESPEKVQKDGNQTGTSKTRERSRAKKKLLPASINVNTAGVDELTRLPRIGPVTAQNIILYREQHGPFKKLKDLDGVKRIGPKTLEQLAPYIIFSDSL